MVPKSTFSFQAQNANTKEDPAVSKFIKFLKHIHLQEKLCKISDSREQKKCVYSNTSLLMWALSVFFSPRIKKFS
jgi:hypothetical protein